MTQPSIEELLAIGWRGASAQLAKFAQEIAEAKEHEALIAATMRKLDKRGVCEECGDTGRQEDECDSCDGTGRHYCDHAGCGEAHDCPDCDGDGTGVIPCKACRKREKALEKLRQIDWRFYV